MLEKFVDAVLALPTAGPDDVDARRVRLGFFVPYLNLMDTTIAQAAEQEFSKAPCRALLALRTLIDRDHVLVRWARPPLTDQELQTKLTLLAVSGGPADAAAAAALQTLAPRSRTVVGSRLRARAGSDVFFARSSCRRPLRCRSRYVSMRCASERPPRPGQR